MIVLSLGWLLSIGIASKRVEIQVKRKALMALQVSLAEYLRWGQS